jgi:ribosomal protein S18 acetylase RimI-like enzyme
MPYPHWYLSQIGVKTAYQGQGIGKQLLQPMLSRFDVLKAPCYLETTTETNVAIYSRFGFTTVGHIPLQSASGRPAFWMMVRPPQAPL